MGQFFLFFIIFCFRVLKMYFFKRVSLKTKLAAVDLHRLISDVRRRVEHEITFEGNEKRTTYVLFSLVLLSSTLSCTPQIYLLSSPTHTRDNLSCPYTRRIYGLKLHFSPSQHIRKSPSPSISPKTPLRLFGILRVLATIL